jgi:hypothetical protein
MTNETKMSGWQRVSGGVSSRLRAPIVLTTLLNALSIAPASARADELPADVKDWKVIGDGTDVTSGVKYTLQNQTIGKALVYGHTGSVGGINLKFVDGDKRKISVQNQTAQGPIKYGDKVALRVDGASNPFLHYQKRPLGINLDWSARPAYEWIVVGGDAGAVVHVGEPFALINTVEKDFLIYAEREAKVTSIRWWKDRNKRGYTEAMIRFVDRHPEIAQYVVKTIESL